MLKVSCDCAQVMYPPKEGGRWAKVSFFGGASGACFPSATGIPDPGRNISFSGRLYQRLGKDGSMQLEIHVSEWKYI